MTKLEKGFEKNSSAHEIFRSAFPIHKNFNWSMPAFDDPQFVEKIGDAPLWGNKFREDDIITILDSLEELGFDTLAVAAKLRNLYEDAGRPEIQKDLKDNKSGDKWSSIITHLLHMVTTNLYKNKEGIYAAKKQSIPGLVLTPEQRGLPLEDRHGLQNNIAANIVMLEDKEFEDLKPQAKKVLALFQKGDKTEDKRQEMLAEKLALEKSYFQKKFPDFFGNITK